MSNNTRQEFPSAFPNKENITNSPDISLELALKILELGNFEERWAIAKVLVKYGKVVIPDLKQVVLDESANSEYRWYALKILSQLTHPQIIFIVSQLLQTTEDEDLIALATQTLANQGKEAIKLLTDLLENPQYRLFACQTLALIPHSGIISPLLTVINDDDINTRLTAISALSKFDHPQVISTLIKALQDPVSEIRREAVTGLGLRGRFHPEIDTVKFISPLLYDLNLKVCQQTALSLSRLKNDSAVRELNKVLQSPHTPIPLQITIVRALAWIASPFSIECLAKSLPQVSHQAIIEIITVLGRMTDYSQPNLITDILLNFYHSSHPAIQELEVLQILCYAWKQLNSVKAIGEIKSFTNHPDDKLRFHAQSTLQTLSQSAKG